MRLLPIHGAALARIILAAQQSQPLDECDVREAVAEGSLIIEEHTATIKPVPPMPRIDHRMFDEHHRTNPNAIWTGKRR